MTRFWPFLLLLPLLLLLPACGDSNALSGLSDDNSAAAQLDKSLAAINDGAYARAIQLLDALNQADPADSEVARYLASAYAGQAGFDALTVIDLLAREDEGGGEQELFEIVSTLFGADGSGSIPGLSGKIDDLASALVLLTSASGFAAEDDRFQAGLYGAVQTVLLSARILDDISIEEIINGNITAGAISAKVAANFADYASEFEDSLRLVVDAKDKLLEQVSAGEQNDLEDDFEDFISDIGFTDNVITSGELENYLISLLPTP